MFHYHVYEMLNSWILVLNTAVLFFVKLWFDIDDFKEHSFKLNVEDNVNKYCKNSKPTLKKLFFRVCLLTSVCPLLTYTDDKFIFLKTWLNILFAISTSILLLPSLYHSILFLVTYVGLKNNIICDEEQFLAAVLLTSSRATLYYFKKSCFYQHYQPVFLVFYISHFHLSKSVFINLVCCRQRRYLRYRI